MSIIEHAKRELKIIGMFAEDADDMNAEMTKNILDLLDVFSKQGHSGFSAQYCIEMFYQLAKYKSLSPLTGEDSEWVEVSVDDGVPLYQNKRLSSVFKNSNGEAYDLDAIYYKEPYGATYTRGRHYINFPYQQNSKCILVDFNHVEITEEKWNELSNSIKEVKNV